MNTQKISKYAKNKISTNNSEVQTIYFVQEGTKKIFFRKIKKEEEKQ